MALQKCKADALPPSQILHSIAQQIIYYLQSQKKPQQSQEGLEFWHVAKNKQIAN